jgi:hypothetical protein
MKKRLNQVLRQVFRQRNNWGLRHSSGETQTFVGVVESWLSKKGLGFRILAFQEANLCSLLLIFGKTDLGILRSNLMELVI